MILSQSGDEDFYYFELEIEYFLQAVYEDFYLKKL